MTDDPLTSEWREHAARASRWQERDDPEPVLEALALSVALELLGELPRIPPSERDRLRSVGQRALLHVGGQQLEDDDLEALRMCAAIARDGLRALAGRPPPVEPRSELDLRVILPPGDLRRLLAGQLDGFAAGSLAMRVRRSPEAAAELAALRRLSRPEERTLALAAAEPVAVLDPAGGHLVGALAGAEAVLFAGPPRRLAVYAEDPEPLRLVAPELTTEDVREGYWIGRVAEGTRRVEAILHVGDRAEPWTIDLS